MMDPVGQRTVDQFTSRKRFKLGVDHEVGLNGALFRLLSIRIELIVADRRDVCSSADASYLSSQIVTFVAGKWRIADNLQSRGG